MFLCRAGHTLSLTANVKVVRTVFEIVYILLLFRRRFFFRIFSAYYAVYECTQVHAGRCGGRSFSKNLLRQIYQGLDHNCRPFKTLCNQLPSSNSRLPGQDTKQHSAKNGHHTIMHTSLAETIRSVVLGIIVSLTSMLWALGGLVTTT